MLALDEKERRGKENGKKNEIVEEGGGEEDPTTLKEGSVCTVTIASGHALCLQD